MPSNSFTKIDDVYESLQHSEQDDIQIVKMICILHPYVDDPAGFKDHDAMPVNHTAHVTCRDMPIYEKLGMVMNLFASFAESNKS